VRSQVSRLLNPRTGNGKIARLPKALRDELNRRLRDGVPGWSLVAWLNSLPEVRTVLAAQFGGSPIGEQNLSQWRKRGYRDWEVMQEALELSERLHRASSQPTPASDPDLTEISPQIPEESDWNPSAGAIDLQRELR